MQIEMVINGKTKNTEIEPGESLLEVLRRLGYYGVKQGCKEGDCGACVVVMNDRAVNSCLVPAARADGKKITTIEGIGTPEAPHPLQRAFAEEGAVQCGYSTPGSIMSVYALLLKNMDPTDEQIKKALDGNLCRCTGYVKKMNAVRKALQVMKKEGRTHVE